MGVVTEVRRGRGGRVVLAATASALALVIGSVAMPQVAVAQTAQSQIDVDIPAQDLNGALLLLTQRAGLQIVYDADKVAGRRSSAVQGRVTPTEALSQMLVATGLTFRFTGGNRVTLEPAPQSADGAVQLGPVRVEGTDGRSVGSVQAQIATEGTGSYTTRALTIGKAPQSIRETPNSVSVVTRQQIEDRNMTSLPDAMNAVTGIVIQPFGNGISDFASRGFSIASIQFDGVATQGAIGSYMPVSYDIAMYDRIEVLRGPAGLFQGSGEPGGTVNIVRKRALEWFQISGSFMAGSWDSYRGELDVTGPLSADGKLRARIVGAYDDRGSYIDLVYARKSVVYGTIEYDLAENTVVSVGASYQGGPSRPLYGLPTYPDGRLLDAPRSTFLGSKWDRKDDDVYRYFADVEHNMSNGGQIIVRYDQTDRRTDYMHSSFGSTPVDQDGNIEVLQNKTKRIIKDRGFDAYITSPIKIISDRDNIVIGSNYRRYVTDISGYSANLRSVIRNVFKPDHNMPMPTFTAASFPNTSTADRWGVYGQSRLGILPATTLVLGGRLDWWEGKFSRNGVTADDGSVKAKFVPYAALVYDLTNSVTLYGSYANTFAPQTAVTVTGDFVEPRSGSQYELGLKGEFMDGALNGHFALFRIEDSNRAIEDPDNPDFSVASGKVRSQGLEAELTGSPLSGWDLTAGYAYTETEFLRGNPGQAGTIFNSGSPKHSLKLWSKYEFAEGPTKGLSVAGGVNLSSGTFSRSGAITWRQDTYAVVSAQLGYRLNQNLEFNLTANNLFDETYYVRVASGGRQSYFGEPRNVMFTLRARH